MISTNCYHLLMPKNRSIATILSLAVLSLLLAACASTTNVASTEGAKSTGTGTTIQTINALKNGGYIIFFRHVQTEKSEFYVEPGITMGNCTAQRPLSEAGWKDARSIGRAFVALQIPVGDVYSSEYCRAWQNADLSFGKYIKTPALNPILREDETAEEVKARALPMFLQVPSVGTNTVLVSHSNVLEVITGIDPAPQGIAYVLRTDGKTVTVIGKVEPQQWAEIAGL